MEFGKFLEIWVLWSGANSNGLYFLSNLTNFSMNYHIRIHHGKLVWNSLWSLCKQILDFSNKFFFQE